MLIFFASFSVVSNVFFNVGYISKAPRFNNVYDYSNQLFRDIRNEQVKAVEGGYSYRSSLFSANVNAYYTVWENKPAYINKMIDNISYSDVVPMNALHKGLEVDFSYKLSQKLSIEGLLSLGDWKWTSGGEAIILDNDNNVGSIVIEGKILNAQSENDEVIYKDKKVVITNIIDEIAYVVEFNR